MRHFEVGDTYPSKFRLVFSVGYYEVWVKSPDSSGSYYLERIPGDAVRSGWESVVASLLGMADLSVPTADGERSVTLAPSSQRQTHRGEPVSGVAHMPQALSEKVVTRALWWIYHCEGTEWQELWRTIPANCLIYEARRSTPLQGTSAARALYVVLRSLAEGLSLADTRTGKILDILKKVEAQKDFVSIVRDMSDAAKQQEVSAMVARISRQAVQGRVAYVAWMADTYGEGALSDEERSLLRVRLG